MSANSSIHANMRRTMNFFRFCNSWMKTLLRGLSGPLSVNAFGYVRVCITATWLHISNIYEFMIGPKHTRNWNTYWLLGYTCSRTFDAKIDRMFIILDLNHFLRQVSGIKYLMTLVTIKLEYFSLFLIILFNSKMDPIEVPDVILTWRSI